METSVVNNIKTQFLPEALVYDIYFFKHDLAWKVTETSERIESLKAALWNIDSAN